MVQCFCCFFFFRLGAPLLGDGGVLLRDCFCLAPAAQTPVAASRKVKGKVFLSKVMCVDFLFAFVVSEEFR